jgi:two-component system chemotaxis sensor kinase CheA
VSDSVNLKEFVSGFVLEADEHLHSVNRNLVSASEALKQGRPDPRAVRELFRSLHTIKGLSSMVGVEPIVDISHEMENILRTADRSGGRLTERALDLLLQGTRALEERVHAVSKQGVNGISPAPPQLLEALGLVSESPPQALPGGEVELNLPQDILKTLAPADREQLIQAGPQGQKAVWIEFQPSPEKVAQGLNITTVRARLGEIAELVKVVPRTSAEAPTGIAFSLLLVTSAAPAALAEAAGLSIDHVHDIVVTHSVPPVSEAPDTETETEWMPTDHASIRVDIRRLDEALERLSELVITRSKLAKAEADLAARGADTRDLKIVISENARQLKRLRTAITEARMVPLSELFQRLPLVVRGLTKDSGKTVNLEIRAGTAEVDKAVADKIFPVVIHLVRNAVDHAIETHEERKQAGKPDGGTLSVICDDSSGTSLILTIRDDGRGINRQAVARKGNLPVARNNEELLQQIATPGLSTRDQVTHTSGRGMGMEIVKRTIELLGGTLVLATTEGKGTSFTIRVPVSVTIVDVMSFLSGDQVFVAPISMIDEIIEIENVRLVNSPVPGKSGPLPQLIQRRGETIPLFGLSKLLHPNGKEFVAKKALVVNQHRGAIAFGVDRMLGQQEVVVRPLRDSLVQMTGIAGATDLGDGRPTLVLDLSTLGANVMQSGGHEARSIE